MRPYIKPPLLTSSSHNHHRYLIQMSSHSLQLKIPFYIMASNIKQPQSCLLPCQLLKITQQIRKHQLYKPVYLHIIGLQVQQKRRLSYLMKLVDRAKRALSSSLQSKRQSPRSQLYLYHQPLPAARRGSPLSKTSLSSR